jgi:hypothetical protein
MQTRILLIIIVPVLFLISCVEDSGPTIYEGGNANIFTQFIDLKAENWNLYEGGDEFTFYQEFSVPAIDADVFDFGTVLFYHRTNQGYELLPITNVFWTEDGVTYSHEFWAAYDIGTVFFNYVNTHPSEPAPPANEIEIKMVILVGDYVTSVKGMDISTDEKLNNVLNLNMKNAEK